MSAMMGVGHEGLFCEDLAKMRDFSRRFLGLPITDEDGDRGICVLSATPQAEHHALALARLRDGAQPTQWVQQLSCVVQSLDDLRTFSPRMQAEGLRMDRTVTHGMACRMYFYDSEDNRIELYDKTGYDIRQPLGASIDLDQPNEDLLACSQSFEVTMGPARGPVSA